MLLSKGNAGLPYNRFRRATPQNNGRKPFIRPMMMKWLVRFRL
jgi:hypothetical protein